MLLFPVDEVDHHQGEEEDDGADEEEVPGADELGENHERGQGRSGDPAEEPARDEEPDEPFALVGVENVVDGDPELGDGHGDEDVGPEAEDEHGDGPGLDDGQREPDEEDAPGGIGHGALDRLFQVDVEGIPKDEKAADKEQEGG